LEHTRPDLKHPCGGKAKGFTVTAILELIERKYGPQVVTEFVRTLPDELRSPIESKLLLPAAWVPIELYFAVVQYLVERFHGGDPKAALEIGHWSAAENIGAFFKAVLSFSSPAMVINMSGRFWKSYYDVGELRVVVNEKGRVVGELSQWPFDDPVTVNELGGSFLAYLEKSRAKDVQLVSAGPVAKGTLRWDISYR
jgi:hypothetical protein